MKKVLFLLIIFVAVLGISSCNPFHTHTGNGEYTVAKEPTCTTEGESQMLCTECGEVAVTVPIPAKGHTEVIIPAVEPTCTETGLTEGKYCSVCDTLLVKPSVVFPRHKFENFICTICGEQYTSNGLKFKSNHNGTCSVAGIGTCTDKDIFVPSVSPNGDTVTSIDEDAFYNNTSIKSITFSDTVTSIGRTAFYGCRSLSNVSLSDSLTSIGDGAFWYCKSLKNITIPDSVTSIGECAFYLCDSLSNITLSTSLTSIGECAFWHCESLKNIEIPESVTNLGELMFGECKMLSSITIPASVTNIDDSAFRGCYSLEYITLDENNPRYKLIDGNLYSKDEKTLVKYAVGKKNVSFSIPETVTNIEFYAFEGCTALKSIEIPDSVTTIKGSAFEDCTALTSVNIPDGVKTIGGIFIGCSSLKNITIPDSVTNIEGYAFRGCTSLKSITIPKSVTSIGDFAFHYCLSLETIYIPASVKTIGDHAISWSALLRKINFDGTVKQWSAITKGEKWCELAGDYTVYCTDGTITKDGAVTYYSKGLAFELVGGVSYSVVGVGTCADTEIIIPSKHNDLPVTIICEDAFSGCYNITRVIFPDSLTEIHDFAFSGCTSLISVVIPDSVTYLGEFAFSNCINLLSAVIGDGVKRIGDEVFNGCTNLTSIVIGQAVESIGSVAFNDCTALKYNIYKDCEYLGSDDNPYFVFIKPTVTNLSSYEIHPETKIIASCAFSGSFLKSVIVSSNVTFIDSAVFLNCASLESAVISNSVTSIGANAFYGCTALKSIELSHSVTVIEAYAFQGCTSLTSVVFEGTIEQWNAINLGHLWNAGVPATEVICSDGTVPLK